MSGCAWLLPADARWEELAFGFTGPEIPQHPLSREHRTFETPQLLGMKRKRTGMPTSQWATLQAFAERDGEISWSSPGTTPRVKKQKQLLSEKLILAFGIAEDPIVWDRQADVYRTKFEDQRHPSRLSLCSGGSPVNFTREFELHQAKKSTRHNLLTNLVV